VKGEKFKVKGASLFVILNEVKKLFPDNGILRSRPE
jgi:hypothetical protein